MSRLLLSLSFLGLTVSLVSGQSLVQAAKKEKERREKTANATRVIDDRALDTGEAKKLPGAETDEAPANLSPSERAKCQKQYDDAQSALETDRADFDQGFPVGAPVSPDKEADSADFLSCEVILKAKNGYPTEARKCRAIELRIEANEKNLAAAGRCLGKTPSQPGR